MASGPEPLSPEIARVLEARYEILAPLGGGGAGTVYRARQVATSQLVAVKVLRLAEERAAQAAKQIARFRREMQLLARLHHPNIVRLIDSGEVGEAALYTVFELVPGESLAEVIAARGALGLETTRHLMAQVLDALSCAHARGVVHRDLKPQNIMIIHTGARENAMVLDFGIGALSEALGGSEGRITEPHELLGTPAYAAPEQLRCLPVDARADLYSFGLVFLECLSGRRVMEGQSLAEVLRLQLSPEPVPLPEQLLHHPLGEILRAATEKDAARRDVTAEGLFRALVNERPWPPTSVLRID